MNVAEEEVILWVTSDLCSTTVSTDSVGGVSTSIPVALFRSHENTTSGSGTTLPYEDAKEAQQYCIVEEEIALPKEKKARKRGVVWNYFVPTVPDRAQCNFCSTVISYKGKSTNNLLRHLRTKHSDNSLKFEETKVESCIADDGSTYYVLSTTPIEASSPSNLQSSFQSNVDATENLKRRGGVWKHFSTDSNNKRAKCQFCGSIISFKGGSTTNLLRHMKSKHANIRHSFAEIVNECVKSEDENEFHPAAPIQFGAVSNVSDNLAIQDDKSGVENITVLSSVDPNFSQQLEVQQYNDTSAGPETKIERKKSALAWNYFSLEKDERAKCTTCSALISFKGGSTGNLLRHLKTKHSEIDLTPTTVKIEEVETCSEYDQMACKIIENKELAKFVQLLNPKYKLHVAQIPRLIDKDIPKRTRKRGSAFTYFDINSDDEIGTCLMCNGTINLKNGSKAALLRHLKTKHTDLLVSDITLNTDTENIENIPMQTSDEPHSDKPTRKMRKRGLVWNHFAPLEDEKAKCITCPAVISYKRGSTSNLLRHMKKKHPEIDVRDEDFVKIDHPVDSMASGDDDDDDYVSENGGSKPVRKVLRKRGRVWNYFKPTAQDKAKCSLCNIIVVYLKGSTTNLLRHMKKKHNQIDLSKEKPFNKLLTYPREKTSMAIGSDRQNSSDLIMSDGIDEVSTPLSGASTPYTSLKTNAIYRRSEVIFRKHFDKFLNRPVSVTKSRLYDEQLAKMIVKQYCPFTIVESDEFRKFVQTVNSGYSLPSRKTISSRLIPELYEKCVEEVRERLRGVKYVTLAANGWTIMNNERYVSITVHFIDDECKLQSYLLDCFKYDESNSAENLDSSIKTILTEWSVIEKVNAIVSDNSDNIAAAARLNSWCHIPCFANIINAIVQCGLIEIKDIIEKVKLISEHLKVNQSAVIKVNANLKEMNLAEFKSNTLDSNRWVNIYELLKQFNEFRQALNTSVDSFVDNVMMLDENEWDVLSGTSSVLKPLLDITNEVSETNVTISKVIPLSQCITNYLRRTLQYQFLNEKVVSVVEKMISEIMVHFNDIEDNILLAESAFLDPRFKNRAFTSDQSYTNVYHSVLQNASSIQLDIGIMKIENINNDSNNCNVTVTKESNIWEEFDSKVFQLNNSQNPETAAATEIENYLQEPLLNRGADPLVWWHDRKSVYPRLFEIMKQRLCLTATAVSKDFTNSRQLVCEKRNKLSSTKVSMVLFLNHNL